MFALLLLAIACGFPWDPCGGGCSPTISRADVVSSDQIPLVQSQVVACVEGRASPDSAEDTSEPCPGPELSIDMSLDRGEQVSVGVALTERSSGRFFIADELFLDFESRCGSVEAQLDFELHLPPGWTLEDGGRPEVLSFPIELSNVDEDLELWDGWVVTLKPHASHC